MSKARAANGSGGAGATGGPEAVVAEPRPSSVSIAARGVRTTADFALVNAAVNAGGKMLKAVEMQYRYGKPADSTAAAGGGLELTAPQAAPAPRNQLLEMREQIDRLLKEGN
jgi:hypothetical protein